MVTEKLCLSCGSDDIKSRAEVYWDGAQFVILDLLPNAWWCNDCNGPTAITTIPNRPEVSDVQPHRHRANP